MIINVDEIKHIYVSAQYQDMRKQINGLSVLVSNCFDMDVMDHSLFIFTNRSCTQIKMLYYDYSGFWLITRKLKKGRFHVKEHEDKNVIEIDKHQLSRLFEGMIYESDFIPSKGQKSADKSAVFI